MKRLFYVLLVLSVISACQSSKRMSNHEIYGYLQDCFADYYNDYNIKIIPLLNNFEQELVKEKYLSDTTGEAYSQLFRRLNSETYFQPPLKKETFNKVVLLKSPSNIIQCASSVYTIDSNVVRQLPFSKLQRKINLHLTSNDSISVDYFFTMYAFNIASKEYREPYVKQTLLLFLYRWYYQSKMEIKSGKENDGK